MAATGSGVQVFSGDARTPAEPAVSSAVREAVDRLADFAPRTALDRLMAGAGLTARERDVVAHAATGMSARDIGERLFIGTRTVETHLARAYHKLGVKSRIELLLRSIGSSTGPPNPAM